MRKILYYILILTLFGACKKGVQGDIGPQGVAGSDGKNGIDNTAKGATGDKGLQGNQGVTGDKGAIGADGAANITSTDWQKAIWKHSLSTTYILGTDKRIYRRYNSEIVVPSLTLDIMNKGIVLIYLKYKDLKGQTQIVFFINENVARINDLWIRLDKIEPNKLIFYNNDLYSIITPTWSSQDELDAQKNQINTLQTLFELEVRAVTIASPKNGRLAAIDYSNYEEAKKHFNLKN